MPSDKQNVPALPADNLLAFIERASRDPNFDIAKFEALLRLRQEIEQREAIKQCNADMARCQSEMKSIPPEALNPFTKSRYAPLSAIDNVIRPIYSEHGFSVSYEAEQTATHLFITCVASHWSGTEKRCRLGAAFDTSGAGGRTNKTDVQAVGSTMTYLRRYTLQGVFNITVGIEDDDGEGQRYPEPPPQPRHYEPVRERINREVPVEREVARKLAPEVPSFQPPPSNGNGADPWSDPRKLELILAKLQKEVAAIETPEQWDSYWGQEKVKTAEANLSGEYANRFDAIRREGMYRIWPGAKE